MGERPGVYVHFEFGVSWPRHMAKDHHITYISKNMRDRANQFPRQLPPTNTNFLAGPSHYPVAYQQVPALQHPQTQPQHQLTYHPNNAHPHAYNRDLASAAPAQNGSFQSYQPPQQQQQPPQSQHYIREYYAPSAPVPPQQRQGQEVIRRSSRSLSRSSHHERGSSAPAPFNNSPWDASNSQGQPQAWKALPATPNQFRLGEDNMPWSTWNFPMGYNDEAEDNTDEGEEHHSRPREASIRATWGPEFPEESPRRLEAVDDRSKGEARNIQSLASALMTVDNGFEDQWWYQGTRLANIYGTVLVPTAVPKSIFHPDFQQGSVGWALAPEERQREQQRQQQQHNQNTQYQPPRRQSFQPSDASFQPTSPRTSVADIVSPISDFSSPLSNFGGLRRSLTTRSDELHM
ncbi:hypothetical protein FZEAL_866 [Fusarium zealandicum]|uniref:Uncharacterized protein n=1 Tax=Fusarium zealandicum TaxID=1053134 RepID=A0A8H4UTY7_9HYPO|nr:hypothetical protein FZEAL_866 [Fusarium zealandicum]